MRAPGRFIHELRAIACVAGETTKFDEDALAKGALVIEFDWPVGDSEVQLRAIYPDSFPRMRPIVQLRGDPASFPKRHCSPTDGTLCLLGRDSGQWPNKWTLADLLKSQLAHALQGTGEEDEQGEPAEYWWNALGQPDSYCLVDSQWSLEGVTSGTLDVRYRFHARAGGPGSIVAAVTSVRDPNGRSICDWQGEAGLPSALTEGYEQTTIPWVYLNETLLPTPHWPNDLKNLVERLPTRLRLMNLSLIAHAQMFAVAYPSNLQHEATGLAWLFGMFRSSKKLKDPRQGGHATVLPTYRAGEQDMGARVPAVRLLRDKRIAVIGLGAIGAPVALELARAGCGELQLIDHDTVEPGNSIRWPLGASAWGSKKASALADFIAREYPWTTAHARSHAVGTFGESKPERGDETVLDAAFAQAELVIDASTSQGVLNILGDYCRDRHLPLISLYASPPVHGGAVARFAPRSACPTCLEIAHDDKTIERAPGFGDLSGLQQPPGCAERTFTGAAYDLQELSLQAVRLVIETLGDPQAAGTSLVQTLSLVDDQGRRTPPTWRVDVIPRNARCTCNTAPP